MERLELSYGLRLLPLVCQRLSSTVYELCPSFVYFELTRLRREVRELRMEREVIKKAAAFFAKDHR